MDKRQFVGVDMGTGSMKAIRFSYLGEALDEKSISYPLNSTQNGFFEQDPEVVWGAFLETTQSIVDRGSLPEAIGLSCAMHSLLIATEEGTPLTPILTWADHRAKKLASEIRSTKAGELLYTRTGAPNHASIPLFKIAWLRLHQPNLFTAPFRCLSIKSFIWYRLFGVFEEDWSLASASGLMELNTRTWFSPAMQYGGITEANLPALVDPCWGRRQVLPRSYPTLRLPPTTPIVVGTSDGCAAIIGSYALDPPVLTVTLGSSGAVRIAAARPVTDYQAMIFNYVLDKSRYISGGAVNNGGLAVDWAIQTFLPYSPKSREGYQAFFEEVEKIEPGSEGLIFLPYLTGERAPIWDENASGLFFGIRRAHTRAHFLRAVLEGICYAVCEVLAALEKATRTSDTLLISGGIIHSPTWLQLLSDMTGKHIAIHGHSDASTLGAALLARGVINQAQGTAPPPAPTAPILCRPNESHHGVYRKGLVRFREIYQSNQPQMDRDEP